MFTHSQDWLRPSLSSSLSDKSSACWVYSARRQGGFNYHVREKEGITNIVRDKGRSNYHVVRDKGRNIYHFVRDISHWLTTLTRKVRYQRFVWIVFLYCNVSRRSMVCKGSGTGRAQCPRLGLAFKFASVRNRYQFPIFALGP